MAETWPWVNTKLYIFLSLGYCNVMITSSQIRAARGLLKWTQAMLAAKAGISIVTLNMIESDNVHPRRTTLDSIRTVLEASGVEFIGQSQQGLGVRFRGEPSQGAALGK
jgi:transcriptional regulator with XRE-family HTH domain